MVYKNINAVLDKMVAFKKIVPKTIFWFITIRRIKIIKEKILAA